MNTSPIIEPPPEFIADQALLARLPTFEARAEAMLDRAFSGIYHIQRLKRFPGPRPYWTFTEHSLSTYDFDMLTRLVLGAHEYCLRIEISQGGPGCIKVWVHPREGREGCSMSKRHPTIQQAIDRWNKT